MCLYKLKRANLYRKANAHIHTPWAPEKLVRLGIDLKTKKKKKKPLFMLISLSPTCYSSIH